MHSLLAQPAPADALLMAQSFFGGAWNSTWPFLAIALGFSVIIFVHELGHFAVAKWAGVRVERFAIGFGREIFGFTRGETRYSFNVLPFGGYVKMLGQEDFDDKSLELQFKDDPRSFINKPVSHRMAIVSAGVVMNVLFAFLLFMAVFMVGMQVAGTRVGYVEPDSPADKADIRPGDRIVTVNGKKILEFNDVQMAIMLAPPHHPVEFVVERGDKHLSVEVTPDYRRPDSTREPRRQVIGIMNGVTPEIAAVGPEIDNSRPDQPHVGDVLVEVAGVQVTSANANYIQEMLVYTKGDVYVERGNAARPEGPPQRVRIDVPPQLAIYPSNNNDPHTVNVLGLTPLLRFGRVDPDGRAGLAGIEVGDTILSWNDMPIPSMAQIARAIRDNAETDIAFKVRRSDGNVVEGFVRPKRNRFGKATVQADCVAIGAANRSEDGPRAKFESVEPHGHAAQAGIEPGDVIFAVAGIEFPPCADVNKVIQANNGAELEFLLLKPDGRRTLATVRPHAPGSIDAKFNLVGDDLLQTGEIVATLNGKLSPAAVAGVPAGARIIKVADTEVSTWRELIEAFRQNAGTTVELALVELGGAQRTVPFTVPHSLRTLLGVGSEARILAIDGRRTIRTQTNRGDEEVHVGYHEGTRAILSELVAQTKVPVEYRPDPLSPPITKYINVAADMVDPWLGRVALAPNVVLMPELKMLKGENLLDALWIGIHKTHYFMLQVYQTMNRMIFSRSVGIESISGPIGIVSLGAQIARAGMVDFLFFMAIISANLAVINFLPLPILDGGLMVFLIIEKIKGSPVSLRVQVATQVIGLFLIVGIFLFVTYNDVLRLVG